VAISDPPDAVVVLEVDGVDAVDGDVDVDDVVDVGVVVTTSPEDDPPQATASDTVARIGSSRRVMA
jgi:hypothetical protein